MEYQKLAMEIEKSINEVFIGKEEVVENLIICLLAGGHVLLEDVPGVGKTSLAMTLAGATGLKMGRIQFTPDTLPGDVIGVSVYNMKSGEFEYREGAVMCQVLLADEINRTSPKTQASLLEAMAEGKVTVDGVRYDLPSPFMVVSTQNPVEYMGTYPLPEAQMDRFMMRLSIGYPDKEREVEMARLQLQGITPETVSTVCESGQILAMQREVQKITVAENVLEYMEEIVTATRKEERFVLGASPRALLALVKAAQAKAYLEERDYVKPDDVKAVAANVLQHRLVLTAQARIAGEDAGSVLKSLLVKVKIPV